MSNLIEASLSENQGKSTELDNLTTHTLTTGAFHNVALSTTKKSQSNQLNNNEMQSS
jgi:hypothetical protein